MTRTEALIQLAAGALANPDMVGDYPSSGAKQIAHQTLLALESVDPRSRPNFDPEPADDETPEHSGIRIQIADVNGNVLIDGDAAQMAHTFAYLQAHRGWILNNRCVLRVFHDGENS